MNPFDSIKEITAIKPGLRVLRQGRQPAKLPLPENLRRKQEVENWRQAIWACKNIWFSSLDPQVRELARKALYRMEKTGHHKIRIPFWAGLAYIYFLTGSVEKMETFTLAVFKGATFLIDIRDNMYISNDLINSTDFESLKPLLIYDPTDEHLVVDEHLIQRAKRLSEFIGPIPAKRPWSDAWMTRLEDLRNRTIAKFGIAEAESLWGRSTPPTPVVPPLDAQLH